MTEKIARRGVRVPGEYAADFLEQVTAGFYASKPVVTLSADDLLETVRRWISTHGPGRSHQGFPVVDAKVLAAHRRRLDETHVTEQSLSWWPPD